MVELQRKINYAQQNYVVNANQGNFWVIKLEKRKKDIWSNRERKIITVYTKIKNRGF